MIQIGDRVQVGSRIGAIHEDAVVVDILPALPDRLAMYRVRFNKPVNRDGRRSSSTYVYPDLQTVEDTTSDECWVDAGIVYGPFVDQNYGWNDSDKWEKMTTIPSDILLFELGRVELKLSRTTEAKMRNMLEVYAIDLRNELVRRGEIQIVKA